MLVFKYLVRNSV